MPPVHPILVHFPIGIVLLAFVAQVIASLSKREDLSRFAWWTQIAGTVALGAAVLSGYIASQSAQLTTSARAIFEIHEQLAFASAASISVLLLWRVAYRGMLPAKSPILYLTLFGLCVLFLLTTGWYGGELVYTHGVGVGAQVP